MGKLIACLASVTIAMVSVCMAADYPGPDNFRGKVNFDKGSIVNFDAAGTLKIGETAVTATAADLNRTKGSIGVKQTSVVTVTNGQPNVALVAGQNLVNPILGATGTTCTNTLANVAVADIGKLFIITVPQASTNILAISQSGNWLSAAVTLTTNQSVMFIATETNKFFKL